MDGSSLRTCHQSTLNRRQSLHRTISLAVLSPHACPRQLLAFEICGGGFAARVVVPPPQPKLVTQTDRPLSVAPLVVAPVHHVCPRSPQAEIPKRLRPVVEVLAVLRARLGSHAARTAASHGAQQQSRQEPATGAGSVCSSSVCDTDQPKCAAAEQAGGLPHVLAVSAAAQSLGQAPQPASACLPLPEPWQASVRRSCMQPASQARCGGLHPTLSTHLPRAGRAAVDPRAGEAAARPAQRRREVPHPHHACQG